MKYCSTLIFNLAMKASMKKRPRLESGILGHLESRLKSTSFEDLSVNGMLTASWGCQACSAKSSLLIFCRA